MKPLKDVIPKKASLQTRLAHYRRMRMRYTMKNRLRLEYQKKVDAEHKEYINKFYFKDQQ